jgi:hypothetical protein
MRSIAIFVFLLLSAGGSAFFNRNADAENDSALKSVQGTWIYAEPGADIWMKAVIKGRMLKGYAASPAAGRFTATSTHKLREVRLIYGNKKDRTYRIESYVQIKNPYLTGDRITIDRDERTEFIVFEKNNPRKFRKVNPDFDPWTQKQMIHQH